jgi:Protein of unknown function (DUF2510)
MSGPANPVAGWYRDPSDVGSRLRFWDGASWTDQTAPLEPAPASSDEAGSWPGVGWGVSPEPEPTSWPMSSGAAPAATTGAALGTVPGAALSSVPGAALSSVPGAALGSAPSSAPGVALGTAPVVPPGAPGAPGAPAWQSGPGGLYAPGPSPSARKSHIGLIVAACVVAVIVVIGGLVALALPTYNRITGHTWFNGGVPGWSPIKVSNFPSSGATLLQAWRVPGPTVGPSKPFLQVAKLKVGPVAGETATQYLAGTLQYLSTHGPGSGGLVTMNDGAPALEWSRPTPLANDPNLAITSFWLYAENDGNAYWIAFQTDTEHYASELPGVEAVMLNFKGTGQ